jgi:monoamine oxidase
MAEEILDVAVVGGGVSGLYSGWRLLTTGKAKDVTVFEASSRLGGRLLSVVPPDIPHMTAELGGMRILPSVQPRVTKLIEELNQGAGAGDKIETYPFPVDEDANISYLRGVYLRLSDFQDNPAEVPYQLNFLEYGKTAGAIVLNAINQVVPGITDPNLTEEQRREMARNTVFGGRPLHKQGFWQVLTRVMSGEAYQLAVAAGGYQSTLTNWNAADAIPWYLSDFGVNPDYRGFKKGFQQVPLTVAERFKAAGGKIHDKHQLQGFESNGDLVTLHFKDGGSVRARRLVLAMPRRSLDLITSGSPLLQKTAVRKLVQSVTPQPLFKLFTTYEYPWWLAAGVEKGRTTTDLPVRQTYYWPKDDGSAATQGRAMLMASYDDGLNIGYWDSFRGKRGKGWRDTARDVEGPELFVGEVDEQGGDQSSEKWRRYRAPQAMVEEVQRQLGLIHGLSYTPKVMNASFKDWGDDPFGGGWNSWNVGVKSWEVREKIIQPVDGEPVYICGEAYSDAQGWVEGALQTADLLLAKLGVGPL